MTTDTIERFNVGDTVYFKRRDINVNLGNLFAEVDIYEHQTIIRTDCPETGYPYVQIAALPGKWLAPSRFESAAGRAARQRPASPNVVHAIDAALNNALPSVTEAAYVQARQKAFDDYKESRAKQGYSGISAATFNNGFSAGFTYLSKLNTAQAFTAAMSRATDPGTSKAAAKVTKAGKLSDMILKALESHCSMTAAELANAIGQPLNAVSPRMRPLINRNLVEVTGVTTFDIVTQSKTAPRSKYRLVDHAQQAAYLLNGVAVRD